MHQHARAIRNESDDHLAYYTRASKHAHIGTLQSIINSWLQYLILCWNHDAGLQVCVCVVKFNIKE